MGRLYQGRSPTCLAAAAQPTGSIEKMADEKVVPIRSAPGSIDDPPIAFGPGAEDLGPLPAAIIGR